MLDLKDYQFQFAKFDNMADQGIVTCDLNRNENTTLTGCVKEPHAACAHTYSYPCSQLIIVYSAQVYIGNIREGKFVWSKLLGESHAKVTLTQRPRYIILSPEITTDNYILVCLISDCRGLLLIVEHSQLRDRSCRQI